MRSSSFHLEYCSCALKCRKNVFSNFCSATPPPIGIPPTDTTPNPLTGSSTSSPPLTSHAVPVAGVLMNNARSDTIQLAALNLSIFFGRLTLACATK